MSDKHVVIARRTGPLLLSMPHGGGTLPDWLVPRLSNAGKAVADTDWWIDRLYDFDETLDATVVRATLSRHVIDVNRDPSGVPLYPGQATTGLCPTETFDGTPIYLPGQAPDEAEIAERRERYFSPYHRALATEIERLKARHGYALLYDCHSIRSRIPRLFDGELPIFNIGTNGGKSCAKGIETSVVSACAGAQGLTHVLNGRFKGGWITRCFGRPSEGIHAVQMELAQHAYMMEAPPWTFDPVKAATIQRILHSVLEGMIGWARSTLGGKP